MDRFDDPRIHEALELLDTAARNNGTQLKSAIEQEYTAFASVLEEFATQMKHRATDTYAAGSRKVVGDTTELAAGVHRSPWAYIGAVSAVALVSGFLLGISRRN